MTSYPQPDVPPVWAVQEAKARFSDMLNACLTDGPQLVTRRGVEEAVLVAVDEWRRLQREARPSLKELLLSPDARTDVLVPARAGVNRRRPAALD